ncbi:MAG: hypothetical protein JL50_07120 [Peptococcaceae bacterium BICA1-7]|nr:MAG: hypothetical protein JL50_07120 [Peptococcaceae bacterium BICA1-7]
MDSSPSSYYRMIFVQIFLLLLLHSFNILQERSKKGDRLLFHSNEKAACPLFIIFTWAAF